MSAFAPPAEVLARQREASDPHVSAWVSANAGSGKTYVLAQRVIRLLLEGTDPAKILCLTFTKAAAANMANRVFGELSKWTALDDAALDDAMRKMGLTRIDAIRRARARRLFAQALETPGGLKVQTIHAFCTRLLHQFPFEANVAAGFEVLDDRAQSELLDRARLAVLLDAASTPDSATGRALATATAAVADSTFIQVVNEAIRLRDKLQDWITHTGSVENAINSLCDPFGIAATDTAAQVQDKMINGPLFPAAQWQSLISVFKRGSKADQEQAARLEAALAETGSARVERYLDVFFSQKREGRVRIATKAIDSALAERLIAERDRLVPLIARDRSIRCRDRTAALLTIAHQVIGRYRAEKEKRGMLDYDDLVGRSLDLLKRVDAAWVHYKLDLGIDHVLIDEAQDTSPQQWEIVTQLVSEFTAGAGARPLARTIFAVGDEKQSIFSFQGAAPDAFAEMRRAFKRAHDAASLQMLPVELKYSFRSLQVILDAVDEVFRRPEAHRGLSADPVPTAHVAVRAQVPGHVEIWPLEQPAEKKETRPWDAPFDTTTEDNPRVTLANKIAKAVRTWITQGELVGDGASRRAVRPGDILVLVRQRGPQFEAIIRALKNADVPVAGADRLVLTEHIAVMDLMALADALLLPDDDLALATILKSPLFGLDDGDLFKLAHGRQGSLRNSLRTQSDARYADISTRLDGYASMAAVETPFAFYSHVLGPDRGRKKLLSRLGPEAIDALDEFLELTLDYEGREAPSLQGFVHWLRAANAEIKRDMEIARDEVRVMTVHGAKGLEAPVVILADTATPPAGPPQLQPKLFALPVENAVPGTPDRIVWAARKDDDVAIVSRARQAAQTAAENEYRRLLYVALTRAADRLIVCGAVGERGKPRECWYELVEQALVPQAVEEHASYRDGPVWRWRKMPADAPQPPAHTTSDESQTVPNWLSEPVAAGAPSVAPTPASADSTGFSSYALNSMERRLAMLRGTIMHRLLQSLPDIALDKRKRVAETYLARAAGEFSDDDRNAMLTQALRILNDLRFAPLFAPGSSAEVPIVGRVKTPSGKTVIVNRQVDRLVITRDAVLIADYKTNRPAPRSINAVPPGYLRQLAEYRALLATIYPRRAVHAALIWTDIPALMEISEAELARTLE